MNYGKAALKRRARQIDAKPVKLRKKCGVIILKILMVTILVGVCVGTSTLIGAVKGILSCAEGIGNGCDSDRVFYYGFSRRWK